MIALALLVSFLLFLLMGCVFMVKANAQTAKDRHRKLYEIVSIPEDLDPQAVTDWFDAISGTLRGGPLQSLFGTQTIALEVWGTSAGITYWIKVPWEYAPRIRPKLEAMVPGIHLRAAEEHPSRMWVYIEESGIQNSHRPLRITDPAVTSKNILSDFTNLAPDEVLMCQWVVGAGTGERKPIPGEAKSKEFNFHSLYKGLEPTKDELNDRRKKLDSANLSAVLRVAAVANTRKRAQYMVGSVMGSYASVCEAPVAFYKRMAADEELQSRVTAAAAPILRPAQLTTAELTALIAWPLGNPMIMGLPQPGSKRLAPSEWIPSVGRTIGQANYVGRERKLAMPFAEGRKHVHVIGSNGTGKSNALGGMALDDIRAGHGLVLIEPKGGLFEAVLRGIPPERMKDVIVFDVSDRSWPVGFNVLEQGSPELVGGQIAGIFQALFPDTRSIWMQEALKYGIPTLQNDPRATLLDLPNLLTPDEDEAAWRDDLVSRVTQPWVRDYWQRMATKDKREREQRYDPLMTRFYPLAEEGLRNILGQSHSSFKMDDVVREDKILLVNLTGIPTESASMMGTFIVNSLLSSIKRLHSEKGLFLYLDEFQHFLRLPFDIEEILAEARSMGLGLVLAHQGLYQLDDAALKQAVMTNARTKLAFKVSRDDAAAIAKEMGPLVSPSDIQRLANYELFAQIMTEHGVSPPVTVTTLENKANTGKEYQIRRDSREQYGRPVNVVEEAMFGRRRAFKAAPKSTRRAPKFGADMWDKSDGDSD